MVELSGHYSHSRIVRSVLPSIGMVLITSVYSIVDGFFVEKSVKVLRCKKIGCEES